MLASCLAQIGRIVQRSLDFHPGILHARPISPVPAICWSNIDHGFENLVPCMPRWYANDNQPIEIPYQRN
jgi:hypothetical protein